MNIIFVSHINSISFKNFHLTCRSISFFAAFYCFHHWTAIDGFVFTKYAKLIRIWVHFRWVKVTIDDWLFIRTQIPKRSSATHRVHAKIRNKGAFWSQIWLPYTSHIQFTPKKKKIPLTDLASIWIAVIQSSDIIQITIANQQCNFGLFRKIHKWTILRIRIQRERRWGLKNTIWTQIQQSNVNIWKFSIYQIIFLIDIFTLFSASI